MTALTTHETDRRTTLDTASTIFDSLGELLLCVDGQMHIVYAPPVIREVVGTTVAAALGADVDAMLRLGRRSDTRAVLRTSRGTRGVNVSLAPYVPQRDSDSDVKYVVVLKPMDEPDSTKGRIVAALEANRWRRDAAARSLGISRATLWRKMRDLGLL